MDPLNFDYTPMVKDSLQGQELDEELNVYKNAHSRFHKIATWWLKFDLGCAFLTYRAKSQPKSESKDILIEDDIRHGQLTFDLRHWKRIWRQLVSKWCLLYAMRIFLLAFSVSQIMSAFRILTAQGRHDYLWKSFAPDYSRTKKHNDDPDIECRLYNIENWVPEVLKNIIILKRKLISYGAVFSEDMGLAEIIYSSAFLAAPFSFFVSIIWMRKRGFSLQVIDIMLEPIPEIQSVRTEIREFSSAMMSTLDELSGDQQSVYWDNSGMMHFKHENRSHNSLGTRFLKGSSSDRIRDRSEVHFMMKQVLSKICILDLVKPANLTVKAQKSLTRTYIISSVALTYFEIVAAVSASIVALVLASYDITRTRIASMNCQNKINDSSFIVFDVYRQFEPSFDELEQYKSIQLDSDDAALKIFKLALVYEAPRYMRTHFRTIFFNLMMTLIGFGYHNCYTIMFLISSWGQITWIDQLNKQIQDCCQAVASIKDSMYPKKVDDKSQDQNQNKHIQQPYYGGHTKVECYESIIRSNLICYLNFLLYRRRYPDYKRFCDYFSAQLTIIISILLVTCYFSGYYTIPKAFGLIILIMFTVVISVNMVWIVPASLLNRTLGVRKKMSKLVALELQAGPDFWLMMKLWQRHLLQESEVNTLFGQNSILGTIAYNHLITLNGYLLAFWIVIFKA